MKSPRGEPALIAALITPAATTALLRFKRGVIEVLTGYTLLGLRVALALRRTVKLPTAGRRFLPAR